VDGSVLLSYVVWIIGAAAVFALLVLRPFSALLWKFIGRLYDGYDLDDPRG
jgi:hypothetical protein